MTSLSIFRKKFFIKKTLSIVDFSYSKTLYAPRLSQMVPAEKNREEPVIVINECDNVDIIGPPDAISNLRPIIRKNITNETSLQKRLRKMQEVTQEWNQHFWSMHNTKFVEEREKYIMKHLKTNETQLTAEKMSEFYKKFLDENWQTHFKYNVEWYKKNFALLLLALQVNMEKFRQKFFR